MLTIVPPAPPRRINLAASWIRKNGARTLTANIRSNSSGEVSRMLPRSVIAAALTRQSTRPNTRSASATMLAHLIELGELGRHEQRLRAGGLEIRAHALARARRCAR